MKININGVVREMTAAEVSAMQDEADRRIAEEKRRPLTELEVCEMMVRQQINNISVDDQTALRMSRFYPEWSIGVTYAVGHKVQYKNKLYKIITAHTAQTDWTPDVAVTLFTAIDEVHDGTKYDPIPYEGNMALSSGLYYTQLGIIYLCNRDTGNPVYHALSDLIGLYVEKI